jgi:aconitate hydratase 2/2-methylisocitrate dehydratase
MLKAYRDHAAERAALGIPPLPLDAKQTAELIELIKSPAVGEESFLMDLLTHRVPPGVDDAAKVKASFLAAVAHGEVKVGLISKSKATELLGTMVGGYNVHPLIELLDDAEVAAVAAEALKKTLLMFDFFNDVADKAKAGNAKAKEVMHDAGCKIIDSQIDLSQYNIHLLVFSVGQFQLLIGSSILTRFDQFFIGTQQTIG